MTFARRLDGLAHVADTDLSTSGLPRHDLRSLLRARLTSIFMGPYFLQGKVIIDAWLLTLLLLCCSLSGRASSVPPMPNSSNISSFVLFDLYLQFIDQDDVPELNDNENHNRLVNDIFWGILNLTAVAQPERLVAHFQVSCTTSLVVCRVRQLQL